MRCMACGGEMVLTAGTSDDAVSVEGFKYETHQCLGCGGTERRLVFVRGSTETTAPPPVSPRPEQPVSSCPHPDPTPSAPPRAPAGDTPPPPSPRPPPPPHHTHHTTLH